MHLATAMPVRPTHRRRWALAAVALCVLTAGCATPIGQKWADFDEDRKIEAIAADSSFPSAAELGLPPAKDDSSDES